MNMKAKLLKTRSDYWHADYVGFIFDVDQRGGDFYRVLDTPHNRSFIKPTQWESLENGSLYMSAHLTVKLSVGYATNRDARNLLSKELT